MTRALLVAVTGLFLIQGARGGAEAPSLDFFKNYFITGDYAVGGASLWQRGDDGVASADIAVGGVPAGVDIIAAFLYVQTAEAKWLPGSGIDHARFNGNDLGPGSSSIAKALTTNEAVQPCWSVGFPGGRQMVTYRADVLRFLPIGDDGKFAVAGPHTVEVPDMGGGLPEEGGWEHGAPDPRALGASLVIVYRDPSQPLRAVVIYDGVFTKQAFATMSLTIQGFYQAATTPAARMTHIVGDGRPFLSERVLLGGALIATNPFASTAGPKWDNPTFTNLPVPPGAKSATVHVTPKGLFSDCLTHSAVVFSTAVQDSDEDGLLDVWETSTTPVLDPNGQPLPNLNAMGARPDVKDVFVEVGYMHSDATTYGGVAKPAHSHLPSHEALKLVGDAFANAPTPIAVHFDVGNLYPPGPADPYIIRGDGLARGGEAIDEQATVCAPLPGDPPWVCQFSLHPGTVGWKSGFRFLRDEVLAITPVPPPVVPPAEPDDFCDEPGYTCERRFDSNRSAMFRYALFAHALGLPKSELPCLDGAGQPAEAGPDDRCAVAVNPEFLTPRTNTGIGDFPGADLMVTLGAFDDADGFPVGTPFQQGATLMHEFGHGFERRHGGEAFEPNCKPTYLSVMNYLYQLRGLLDDSGRPHVNFSSNLFFYPTIDETALADGFVASLPYRIGWYAPLDTSYLTGRTTAVRRHCDGSELLPTDVPSVRIDARTAASGFDWNANGATEAPTAPQDVNFNGRLDGGDGLRGSDDWSNILLNQIGSRRNVGALFVNPDNPAEFAVGPLSVDVGKGDLGKGDLGKGDLGKGDLGKGDLGKGDLGKGDLGKGDLGKGDLGKGDLGGGDLFLGDPLNPSGELDFETATELAKTPPTQFAACVVGEDCEPGAGELHDVRATFGAPTIGGVASYRVYRVQGDALLPGLPWALVGTLDALPGPPQGLYTLIDTSGLTNGAQYTFFAVALYTDGTQSDPSNLVTITAVNDPPVAGDDSYTTDEDTALAVSAPGVLANDDDPDDESALTSVLVSGPAHAASFTLNADGSFSYTPAANFNGSDTFSYTATSGEAVSNTATVSITVNAVNDRPTISDIGDQTIDANATTGPLAFTIGDVDGLDGLIVTGSSSDTTLVPIGNIVFGGAGAARTVTVTPAPDKIGTTTIIVTVTDPGGLAASDSFVLTVKANYTFVAVKNLPPPGKTRAGSTVPLKWQFKDGSTVVDSSLVTHTIEVVGPCTTFSGPCSGGTVRSFANTDPGGSSFRYEGGVWSFNLQTKDSTGAPYAAGFYRLTIRPGTPGFPASPTYSFEVK